MILQRLAALSLLAATASACATPTTEVTTLDSATPVDTVVWPTSINLTTRTPAPPSEPITGSLAITDTSGITSTALLTATDLVSGTVPITMTELSFLDMPPETLLQLREAVVTLDGEDYQLIEGVFEDPAASVRVDLLPPAALGDLDADGDDDAVVTLVMQTGGTGSFRFLAAMLADGGTWRHVDSVALGDRVRVNDITIAGGLIDVGVVTHGPDDPMCCPTLEQVWSYRLLAGRLQQTSEAGPPTTAP